jgi:hypothetical protein
VRTSGLQPSGRNGHTATIVGKDDNSDNKLYIIGGWLGSGPLAADDLHILDLDKMEWIKNDCTGVIPGPCNMHTADNIDRNIYVFR